MIDTTTSLEKLAKQSYSILLKKQNENASRIQVTALTSKGAFEAYSESEKGLEGAFFEILNLMNNIEI